jgi:integrase
MKRLPGFRFDAKAQLAHFEVVLPGVGVSKHGKRKFARRRCTVAAKDVIEATAKYHAFRREVLEAKPPPPPPPFGSYIERHWPTMKKRVSKRTARLDTDTIENRLLPFFGALDLAQITGPVVRDFVGALRRDGYMTRAGEKRAFAPDTINQTLRTLRKILRDAVERGELATYPIRGRLPLEKTAPLRLELSREELRAFVGAFDDEAGFRTLIAEEHAPGPVRISDHFGGRPRVFGGGLTRDSLGAGYYFDRFHAARVLFVVALETGLSKRDLLGLRWASVDLENGWVRATRGKTKVEAQIPISAACRAALKDCDGRDVRSAEFVFVNEEGKPYPASTLLRHFEIAKKLAGIRRRFRFHDLRHTFASRLASRGQSLQVIARALGHTTARMAERYARPDEEAMRGIAAALDADSSAPVKCAFEIPPGAKLERVMGIEPTTSSLGI